MNEYAEALRDLQRSQMQHKPMPTPKLVDLVNAGVANWWGGVKDRTRQLASGDLSGIARALPEAIYGIRSPEHFQAIQSGQEAWYPPYLAGMTVYHGSPHKFDAFDLSKIGTGEGAQAYGHGLYFAEDPKVGKYYATNLAGKTGAGMPGRRLPEAFEDHISADVEAFFGEDIGEHAANRATQINHRGSEIEYVFEDGSIGVIDSDGNYNAYGIPDSFLYEVDVPDEAISQMLDWDAPLSEQPENVRRALAQDIQDFNQNTFTRGGVTWVSTNNGKTLGREVVGGKRGEALYWQLAMRLGGRDAASEYLNSLGIPGIRYFDGGSRAAGEGTRNIVLFDDKLAKVLKRNNEAVGGSDAYANLVSDSGELSRADRIAALRAEANAGRFGAEPDVSYRGQHQPPARDYGAPMDDITKMFPDDFYGPHGTQYYGTGDPKMDEISMRVIRSARGKPDKMVTVYRAVPKGVTEINPGDWVTPNRKYAKIHGESWVENGMYDVIEKKVRAGDLFTEGNSVHEFGWVPE